MKVGELWKEFRGFALKGNIIDLAVAVVIGTAFSSVITSLVKNVIMPAISYLTPSQVGYRSWHIGRIEVGSFLGELLNFLIIAWAMFLITVKLAEALRRVSPLLAVEPETRACPLCLSIIPAQARKCAHCTADLTKETPS